MLTSHFNYHLPQELIAQRPAEPRDASRMLVLERGSGGISHMAFRDLPSLLQLGDMLVINDTRVIPARLLGRRSTGAQIEVLLLNRLDDGSWRCLVNPGRKMRPGDEITFSPELSGTVLERLEEGTRRIGFSYDGDFEKLLDRLGHAPLPPYIRRERPDAADRERYQTVYAAKPGAVAAPTAGLHFSGEVLREVEEREIGIARITLHVGLGTFRPVKAEKVEDHRMDAEWFEIGPDAAERINKTKSGGGRVIAVGTTVVRSLESSREEPADKVQARSCWTGLFITPGFQFRVVDALLTNFHLPRSTLLMLVSAFAGREGILAAYEEAVRLRYRFYSYGDCMLII
jgi:S-adenosylmethionine:tRNA ribosyltransferase-isomerase